MTKLESDLLHAVEAGRLSWENAVGGHEDWFIAEAVWEVAKRYIMDYNTFMQANIGSIVPSLRDHGAHAAFCDKLNDLRNKFLENGVI